MTDMAAPAPIPAGSSFYTAMRILPEAQREGMYQVYAFCRAVDDIADEGGARPDRVAGLEAWRKAIVELYVSGATNHLTSAIAPAVNSFRLRREDFLAVIDGMEMDAREDIRAPDWATLDLYCERVASAVGRLSNRVFGIDGDTGAKLAHHLGRALQLTNILRDLDEDAGIGRLYLPREALEHAGIASRDIATVLSDPQISKACLEVAERARLHFAEADRIMATLPRAKVKSPRVMGTVYRMILDKLIARGFAAPRGKARPSKPKILWAVVRHGLF